MGRLQRKKKSSNKKKKKKTGFEPKSPSQKINGTAFKKMVLSDGPPNENKGLIFKQKQPALIGKLVSGTEKIGFWDKGVQFLREVKVELKKVTWPSRKQTMGSTAVVIILVIIISLFLGIVDFGLSGLIRAILK